MHLAIRGISKTYPKGVRALRDVHPAERAAKIMGTFRLLESRRQGDRLHTCAPEGSRRQR
jgi:hypothetical protein